MRREGETWGGLSPHHPTMGLGERRKLPQRGPGPPKIDFMHISSPKEAIWNTFSVFLSDGGAPQTSRGPGNFPFPPPLDGPGGIKWWTGGWVSSLEEEYLLLQNRQTMFVLSQ